MAMLNSNIADVPLFRKGKVRDVYDLDKYLLFVASDRISAFDVIMQQPIPDKGKILTKISKFWFQNTQEIVPNHLISTDIKDYPEVCHQYADQLEDRSMLVLKTKPINLECIVRGYIAGSGWKEYKESKTICEIKLPENMREYDKLKQPIFTPSTKAEEGHDQNISFKVAEKTIGAKLAANLKDYSIKLFEFASQHLLDKGIILADTKFEFGLDDQQNIILIDEVLTPDSSRFWLQSDYGISRKPYNFDKQILRDYLETTDWNKLPPAPILPDDVIEKTLEKYRFAEQKILS